MTSDYSMTLLEKARALRKSMTPTEKILWARLRGKRYAGLKFKRQQFIGRYIVDFYCAEALVAVELDGDSHVGRERYDTQRDAWLKSEGLRIVRVWDNEIYTNLEGVLELIFNTCAAATAVPLTPSPSPPRGEGDRCAARLGTR
ncbi:MAG: DUF559 domain-containing protein [Planctomycetota bacterium]